MTNAKTGKIERVFVDLNAVYPNDDDPNEEMSFEELRAQSRGWLSMEWKSESMKSSVVDPGMNVMSQEALSQAPERNPEQNFDLSIPYDHSDSQKIAFNDIGKEPRAREAKNGRPRKMKIMEVKGETQTSRSFNPKTSQTLLISYKSRLI